MNLGGFSWKRFVGISAAKSRISRSVGIPITKSGRQRKIGRTITGGGCLLMIGIGIIVILAVFFFRPIFSQSTFRILLSNDDGIDSPGLAALFDKLSPLGKVTVAASANNQSGVSHGITSNVPIRVEEVDKRGGKWYVIDALPVTCMRLAIECLLPEKPDIVIVGINKGDNTGVVTFYSATVACAREAAFIGLPAIAVHLEKGNKMDYEGCAAFIAELVKEIQKRGLKRGIFLNVNFPALPEGQIKGVLITKQDTRGSLEYYEKRTDADGKYFYWPGYRRLEPSNEMTDISALRNGYISITPFQFDQTAFSELKSFESWATSKSIK